MSAFSFVVNPSFFTFSRFSESSAIDVTFGSCLDTDKTWLLYGTEWSMVLCTGGQSNGNCCPSLRVVTLPSRKEQKKKKTCWLDCHWQYIIEMLSRTHRYSPKGIQCGKQPYFARSIGRNWSCFTMVPILIFPLGSLAVGTQYADPFVAGYGLVGILRHFCIDLWIFREFSNKDLHSK